MIGIEWMTLLITGVLKFVGGFIFLLIVLGLMAWIISIFKNPGGIKQFLNKMFQKKNPPDFPQ